MSGDAEEVELKAMWPARVLLTLDEHFQLSTCRGIQEKQSGMLNTIDCCFRRLEAIADQE